MPELPKPTPPKLPVSIREFADEVIRESPGNLDELRASMQHFGWLEHLPALQDEHGVTLVGHRRLKVAAELGIGPVTKTITFGTGTAADAERLKLALASNLGGEPLSKKDRKRIAERMYGSGEWTIAKIAEALGAGFTTIQRDLSDFIPADKIKPPKRGRPKGSVHRHEPVAYRSPPITQQRAKVGEDDGDASEETAADILEYLLERVEDVLWDAERIMKLLAEEKSDEENKTKLMGMMRGYSLASFKRYFAHMRTVIEAMRRVEEDER